MSSDNKNKRKRQSDLERFLSIYGKYCILGAIALVLIIILVVSVVMGGNEEPEEGQVLNISTESATETTAPEESLEMNAIPEINDLFTRYFEAMKNRDVATLTSIVASNTEITQEDVDKQNEYIEDYVNINCYTREGLLEDTYIVFVYYENKFTNIDTTAPALYRYYVCKNEDGSFIISNGTVDGEVAAYIDEVSNREDVIALRDEVDRKLEEAMAADEKLAMFVNKLREGASQTPETQPSESESAAETQPSESQTETQAASESAAETQPSESQTETQTQEPQASSESAQTTTVYALQNVKIRKEPSTDSEEMGRLAGAASIERISDDGTWSKVLYNGQECYIMSEFLTTTKPDTLPFQAADEDVYAVEAVNVRSTPSTDGEIVGKLAIGDSVHRTGYTSEWSQVEYEGETCYVASEYLSTEEP